MESSAGKVVFKMDKSKPGQSPSMHWEGTHEVWRDCQVMVVRRGRIDFLQGRSPGTLPELWSLPETYAHTHITKWTQ